MKFNIAIFIFITLLTLNSICAGTLNSNGTNIDFGKGIIAKENGFDIIRIPLSPGISEEKITIGNNEYKYLKGNSNFKLNNGELIEAEIYNSKETEYNFKGNIIKVPENSKLIFKDNKVVIYSPDYSKIKEPVNTNPLANDMVVLYQIPEKGLILENDIPIKPIGKNNELFYDLKEKAFYVSDKGYKSIYGDDFKSLYEVGGIGIGGIIEKNTETKIYLFFDGKKHEGNYLSFSRDQLIVGSSDQRVFVNIGSENILGIKNINNVIFSVRNGEVVVKKEKLSANSESFGVLFGNEYIKYEKSLDLIYKTDYKDPFKLPDFEIEIFDKNKNSLVIGKINDNNYGIDIGQGMIYHQGLTDDEKDIFSKMLRSDQIRVIGMNNEEASKYISSYYSEKLDPNNKQSDKYPDESKYKYASGTIIIQELPGGVVHSSIILNENGNSWVYLSTPPKTVKVPLESYFKKYFYYNLKDAQYITPEVKFSEREINTMIEYANSQLGRPYGVINEPYDKNQPSQPNCALFVGAILDRSGEYRTTGEPLRSIDFRDRLEKYRIKK